MYVVQSCSTDEPSDDTNGVTNEVDNAPILNTSPEQLPNVPMYTDTDYERMLKYKNTICNGGIFDFFEVLKFHKCLIFSFL